MMVRLAKTLIVLFLLSLVFHKANAQVEKNTALFNKIRALDSIIFERGFNACAISEIEPFIADDLEFYHDEAGITQGKEAFLSTIRQNICSNTKSKPIRKLGKDDFKVYPLFEDGVLYGAVQNGEHEFYSKEDGKEPYLTSTALYSHLWIKKDNIWKLKRVLSFDHQPPKQQNTPKEICVPTSVLKTYVGEYKSKNTQAHISTMENTLIMKSGTMEITIYPASEILFYAKQAPLTFEFENIEGSKIKMAVLENGKKVDILTKVQ
ncbi:nuclear transport factor 2 family protein [Allomuricauda sp. CP2A]|jgi:hypothetical protein|uniref:nuclear transport factor 2 family protein n=1 Tax=Allomuricauda sp. CP2A TaxID=1848189 RepID=UPI00082D02CF|nr:nuclear transport factor 2 family protein [Muricauda sp. CP2A]